MPKPREIHVSTLKDFTGEIEKSLQASRTRNPGARLKGNWYRGHGLAASFKLDPALYRHPKIRQLRDFLILEKQMLDDFCRQAVLHEFGAIRENKFEMLFYMQHYGIPTRLLDWSVNPYIALYFALTDSPASVDVAEAEEDAAVWILDPVAWNGKALEELAWSDRGPALPEDTEIKTYYPRLKYEPADIKEIYEYPVAILGVSNNARMFAQKGVFTVFGRSKTPMESIYDQSSFPSGCLSKIVIKKSNVKRMLDTLISIGFTDSVSYPDLYGLAREIRRHHGFKA